MRRKYFIKNSVVLIVSILIPILVSAQKPPKKQKVFAVQVFENDSLYEAQVRAKTKRFFKTEKMDCMYYWFNSGKILRNQGSYVQNPLHGKYIVKNSQKKVVVQGTFCNGLHVGTWKYWDSQGNLLYTQQWKEGEKHGEQVLYSNSKVIAKKRYSHNNLHGKSIVYKDTPIRIVSKYKKGICVNVDTLGIVKPKVKGEKKCPLTLCKKKEKPRYDLLNTNKSEKLTFCQKCKKTCKTTWGKVKGYFKKDDTKKN